MILRRKQSIGTLAGKYYRLSIEDGDKKESNSITNQRELVTAFLQKHPEIKAVDEYVDDGYSGTNFDRPAFKRMMEDCTSGKINCIIVKDLSRLGRDYIGMGKFMEQIFPKMGIRFIAINDNYDNAAEDNGADEVIVPFKNLINDAYCRDISTKIRSQLDVKRRRGDFIGNYAPYGYQKDEHDHNHLVVDEYASGIVTDIFQWKIDGLSAQRIAERLNTMGVLAPSGYKHLDGGRYRSGFKSGELAKWQAIQVLRILNNEVYLGTMVQGKRQKVNYKVKKVVDAPEDQWVRVEDTHEAIISRATFDTAQEVLKLDTRASEGKEEVSLFSGIVECGCCGANMVRHINKKKGKKYAYIHCTNHRNERDGVQHSFSERRLTEIVLAALQTRIEQICDLESKIEELAQLPRDQRKAKAAAGQIEMLQKEMDKYAMLRRQVYEDMNAGIVTKEDYLEFNRTFTQKIEAAQTAQQEVRRQQELLMRLDVSELPWIENFKKYRNLTELNRRVLVELVERIVIVDKDNIVIRYRFGEEIESVQTYSDACMEGTAIEQKEACAV